MWPDIFLLPWLFGVALWTLKDCNLFLFVALLFPLTRILCSWFIWTPKMLVRNLTTAISSLQVNTFCHICASYSCLAFKSGSTKLLGPQPSVPSILETAVIWNFNCFATSVRYHLCNFRYSVRYVHPAVTLVSRQVTTQLVKRPPFLALLFQRLTIWNSILFCQI